MPKLPPADTSFSKRHGFVQAKPITIRQEAPESLRYFVLQTVVDLGYQPSLLRSILCAVLRTRPDPNNWSEHPNVWSEAQDLMFGCPWYKVYDIIEALHAHFAECDQNMYSRSAGLAVADRFAEAINQFFVEEGIGWQLLNGEIVTRGSEAFETAVNTATAELNREGRPTAATHIHEALQALSRRPTPDLSGAVYHAMGSLECVARDIAGDERATLGEILKCQAAILPKPLDEAVSKIWGYASNQARHVAEGRATDREEAELIVGLAATVATYLTRKNPQRR
jgi:hypothetical protein